MDEPRSNMDKRKEVSAKRRSVSLNWPSSYSHIESHIPMDADCCVPEDPRLHTLIPSDSDIDTVLANRRARSFTSCKNQNLCKRIRRHAAETALRSDKGIRLILFESRDKKNEDTVRRKHTHVICHSHEYCAWLDGGIPSHQSPPWDRGHDDQHASGASGPASRAATE